MAAARAFRGEFSGWFWRSGYRTVAARPQSRPLVRPKRSPLDDAPESVRCPQARRPLVRRLPAMTEKPAASFAEIRAILAAWPAADLAAATATAAREAQLTKPAGSLGRLEELSAWLASWQGRHPPKDRKSTRLNSSHIQKSRMPSSA